MDDTQWPRYQVFLQEKEGEPHQDAGSVHAPDAEMALLNARDVFVRRPECVSLWVVAVNTIFSRTAEALEGLGSGDEDSRKDAGVQGSHERFYVFCKLKPAGKMTLVGQVEARTPGEAMERAVEQFSGQPATPGDQRSPYAPAFAWWVFPAREVFRSRPQDIESMFSPALNKPFRLSTDFRTLTAMREINKPDRQLPEADHPARAVDGSTSTNR